MSIDIDEVEHWSELLNQGEFWLDGNKAIHSLDGMTVRHCANVHAFLLRQASEYLDRRYWSMCTGPEPPDEVIGEMEAACDAPEEWMKCQPLLVALARRMEGLPAHPAETVNDPWRDDEGELREPDNPAATALAQHIADHSMSTVQAAFRILGMKLNFELAEDQEPA